MKTQTFTVKLTFSEKMTSDEDIKEIAQNIAESLKHTSHTAGLAPDGADGYTTEIEVTPQFLPEASVKLSIL